MTPISVVVPTYDRAAACSALVAALLRDFTEGEVIVVAQGNTAPLVHDPRVRIVTLSRPSLTRARNRGIELSRGRIVLFLDDDCTPCAGLVHAHLHLHALHPAIPAVAGMVRDRYNQGVKPHIVTFDERTLRLETDYAVDKEEEVPCGPGGHLSLKREVFDDVRFDPWFAGNAHFEEIDFALRLRRRGGRMLFTNQAAIDHHIAEDGGCRSARDPQRFYRDRFFNRGLCFAKNCPLRHLRRFLTAQRHELEYFSRNGRKHRPALIAAGLGGLAAGLAAGLVRRRLGPAWYR